MNTSHHASRTIRDNVGPVVGILALGVAGLGMNDYGVYVLTTAVIFAVAAVGLDVLLGFTGYLSIAQGAFFGLGAYATAILTSEHGFSWWTAFPVVVVGVGAAGVLLGLPAFRARGLYFAVVTLGIGLVLFGLFGTWTSVTGGSGGYVGIPVLGPVPVVGRDVSGVRVQLWLVVLILLLTYFCAVAFTRSAIGSDCRAVRDDEDLAEALGINVPRARMAAFVFAAAAAGAAGSFFAVFTSYLSPGSFSVLTAGFQIVVMVVVGGSGTLWGPVIGAVVLVSLPEILRGASEYSLLIYGVVLLAVILFAPDGVAGLIRRMRSALVRIARLGTKSTITSEGVSR